MTKTVMVMGKEDWVPSETAMKQLGKSERSVQRLAAAGHLRWKLEPLTKRRLYHAGDLQRVKEEGIRTQAEEPRAIAPRAMTPLILAPEAMAFIKTQIEAFRAARNSERQVDLTAVPIREKLWLSLEEASEYSGLSMRFLRDSIVEPKYHQPGENLAGIRVGRGGSWRIQRASLEAFAG